MVLAIIVSDFGGTIFFSEGARTSLLFEAKFTVSA
jgi:hypothetical protein